MCLHRTLVVVLITLLRADNFRSISGLLSAYPHIYSLVCHGTLLPCLISKAATATECLGYSQKYLASH